MASGGVVPLDGAVRVLENAVSNQAPAVFNAHHGGPVFSQGQRMPHFLLVFIDHIADTAIFFTVAVEIGLFGARDDVLFILCLQLEAAIQKPAGSLITAVLQKLADVVQSFQVGRTELAYL